MKMGRTEMHVTLLALQKMNGKQFEMLRDSVIAPGLWDTVDRCDVSYDGARDNAEGTIMVVLRDRIVGARADADPFRTVIVIGIEPDGYTHS